MHMKKSLLAVAFLGLASVTTVHAAAATAHQESVNVRFAGEVKIATCQVTVGQQGNLIDLGIVKPAANSEGVLVPVVFNFTDCQSSTLKDIQFAGGQNGGQDNWQTGVLGTDRKNVTIQLYNDATASGQFTNVVAVNKQFNQQTTSHVVTPFFARLKVGGAAAEPGKVNSAALFTVSYQ